MSMRARLRDRQLPVLTVAIRIDFSADADAAEKTLAQLTRTLRLAELRDPDADHTEQRDRLTAAQAGLQAQYYEVIRLRALPPADMEALIAAHPPTPAQRTDDPAVAWNKITFRPALIAACAQGEETEQDWAQWLTSGAVTDGEVAMLFAAVIQVNDRSVDLRVGKDSAPNLN